MMKKLWTSAPKPDNESSVEQSLYKIGMQAYNILLPTRGALKENDEDDIRPYESEEAISPPAEASTSGRSRRKLSRAVAGRPAKRKESVSFISERERKSPGRGKLWKQVPSRLDTVAEDETETDVFESHNSVKSSFEELYFHHRVDSRWCRPSYIPISLIMILIFLVVLLPLLDQNDAQTQFLLNKKAKVECINECSLELVESIPEGLAYSHGSVSFVSTYDVWKKLINISQSSIEIASFYWTLRKSDVFPDNSSFQGDEIYNNLLYAGLKKNITVRIAQNQPDQYQPNTDTDYLVQVGAAQVKSLNFTNLMGDGVLHTKFWIVDRQHIYIGSANMDWRSLTQVKELGAVIYNCPCVAEDLAKVFQVYWDLGNRKDIPNRWPDSYSTAYNAQTPFNLSINGDSQLLYISSSPNPFSPRGRTQDIEAVIKTISSAKRFVYIAVMDYFPLMIYSPHIEYWPVIDNELRRAVIDRGVHVRLLISNWQHTRPMAFNFLRSLTAISGFNKRSLIEVRLFKVPSNSSQSRIPFARVNHNKYMVTDNTAFIGTSNWSGDYFVNTAGVSLVLPSDNSTRSSDKIRLQLGQLFQRDWDSEYSTPLIQ